MKVSSWQDVIISWANALRLLEEPISDVLDLVKGSFFVKLLSKTKTDDEQLSEISEDDIYSVIETFLKDEFSNFRLLGYWDADEVTLVASVLLLWSSLESQSLRTPLYELDNALQLKIQAFIQSFIETPRHLVNRQLVTDAVLEITSDGETDEEASSFVSSPRTYSTPKRSSFNSNYSPAFLALSEVRSLRNKVDLLNCEKQHFQEELEHTKSQLIKTRTKLEQKEAELNRLKNSCINGEEERLSSSGNFSHFHYGDSKTTASEFPSSKLEIEELKEKLRQDLESAVEENNQLVTKIKDRKLQQADLEIRCIELDSKNMRLNSRVEELENLITSLRKTCEEQSGILAEKMKPLEDESFQLRDCESLGGIIDIKYSELQEELKMQTELLTEKTKEVKTLLEVKNLSEKTIADLRKEIKSIKSECSLRNNKIVGCSECSKLKENFTLLQQDFCNKCDEYSKLKEELIRKNNEIKILINGRTSDENRIADLREKISKIVNDYNLKCEEYKEEIITLKSELHEKSNSVEFFLDETDFLNNCLEDKKRELQRLETDYNKINLSKDREIAQLMITIDHLNKEVRKLQGQLHGECTKNELLCHSAYQWRQKVSHGNTANEELARELIVLHESLELKTLKVADLSDQIEQLKGEMVDKEKLNKELHERLLFLTEKNSEVNRELQSSKNTIAHLQARISSLEFNEKRLNHEIVRRIKKYELVDNELKELRKVLREKFLKIDLDMDTCTFRGNPSLQEIIEFIDFIKDKLKESKENINHLTVVINELETENSEKTSELDLYMKKVDELASVKGTNALEAWKEENSIFQDKLKKIESDYDNTLIKLQDTRQKLELANESLSSKNKLVSELKSELNYFKQELKGKEELVECLQQNVNLYEHEKNILERKLSNLSAINGDKAAESVHTEDNTPSCEREGEKQMLKQESSLGSVSDDIEVKLKKAINEQVSQLQMKMKAEFDEELQNVVEEYSKKVEQLKGKVKKDCLHIEHLSSELWETSDRLLLAQQESDALRSQLKKTRTMLVEQQLSNRGIQDSHSFMWLGGVDAGSYVDELVTVTTKRTFQTGRLTSDLHMPDGSYEDDEEFNNQCLEDLKAGICRLPSPVDRLSCPAESTRREDDDSEMCMRPPDKPRKMKTSITYRKPGPPTPSINAARHSLPGNEKLELRRGLREQNGNVSHARSRLSQLFGSIHLTKPKYVQESPKVKRKGFFQRTFGNRENMPPKS